MAIGRKSKKISSIDYENIVELERQKYNWYKKCDDIALVNRYPDATPADRLRFLISSDGNLEKASKALGECLKWRKEKGIDNLGPIMARKEQIANDNPIMREDDILWFIATTIAYSLLKESNLKNPKVKTLPRIYSLANKKATSLAGYRIIQFLGARIDLSQASPSVYALAGVIFVDLIEDRQSMEKFVYAGDVREGSGWSNHSANHLMPFIREIIDITPKHQCERMETLFAYPVPTITVGFWNIIKPLLDPTTRDKTILFSGSASTKDKTPEELKKVFSTDVIKYLEKNRKSLFYVK